MDLKAGGFIEHLSNKQQEPTMFWDPAPRRPHLTKALFAHFHGTKAPTIVF